MAIIGEQELKDGVVKLRSVTSREEVSRGQGGCRTRAVYHSGRPRPRPIQDRSKSAAFLSAPTWKGPKGSVGPVIMGG